MDWGGVEGGGIKVMKRLDRDQRTLVAIGLCFINVQLFRTGLWTLV